MGQYVSAKWLGSGDAIGGRPDARIYKSVNGRNVRAERIKPVNRNEANLPLIDITSLLSSRRASSCSVLTTPNAIANTHVPIPIQPATLP